VRKLVILVTLIAVLGAPATAPATSNLRFLFNGAGADDDTVTVGESDVEGFQVKYSLGCFFGCVFKISSIYSFNNLAPGQCTATAASTDFDCIPPGRITITGSPGPDSVEGSCFFSLLPLTMDAGAGNDRLTIGCAGGNIELGPGDDDLAMAFRIAAAGTNLVRGGDGDDRIVGIADADTFQAGAGRDFLRSGDGDDTLDGGVGNDVLEGENGADTLTGGAGRDTLDGGPGTDSISGGDGHDTVTYEERAAPLIVTLDGAANDGEAGENDVVAGDIEDVIGGTGDDTITGSPDANEIDGGDGGDVIDGGGGRDLIDAGSGNDRVTSRDGIQESIDCGEGNDLAVTDEFDIAANCETVQASRELMPDVDNDGIQAPADCDDHNAGIRPGLPDKPGNRIDENCDGQDTPFGRVITPVQSLFSTGGGRTRVLRLRVVDVPAGAVIQLRCAGGKQRGCFRGVKRFEVPRGAAAKNVRKPLAGRELIAGAVLEVRVLVPDSIGKVVRYTMRSGSRLPSSRLLCLIPGARRPGKC
jgi:Ca2+-binding RTX toxin-like protein